MKGKGSGWRNESHRHRLAGMGISTQIPKIQNEEIRINNIYLRESYKEEPEFEELVNTLVDLDGIAVEGSDLPQIFSKTLLKYGMDLKDRHVIYDPLGEEGFCVGNTDCFFEENKSHYDRWGGYALNPDGWWVFHWWMEDKRNGDILEITPIDEPFQRYWGIKVTKEGRYVI